MALHSLLLLNRAPLYVSVHVIDFNNNNNTHTHTHTHTQTILAVAAMAHQARDSPATEAVSPLRDGGTVCEAVRQGVSSCPVAVPPSHVTETEAAYARRIATLTASKKVDLLRECRRLGVTGNHNTPKRVLLRRLTAHLHRSRADGRRSTDGEPQTALMSVPVPHGGDRSAAGDRSRRSLSPSPTPESRDGDMAATSTLDEALRAPPSVPRLPG